MKIGRFLARFFGWLLTPVVAWAASFFGAATVSWLVSGWGSSRTQLTTTVIGGGVSAVIALVAWLRLLRKSPKLRATLRVDTDGTPLAAIDPPE